MRRGVKALRSFSEHWVLNYKLTPWDFGNRTEGKRTPPLHSEIMAVRLYPDLSEPWSDLDDEELDEKEEPSVSKPFYNGRDRETPANEASTSHKSHPNSSSAREHTDAVNLADFQDYYMRHKLGRHYRREAEPQPHANSAVLGGRRSVVNVFLLLSRGKELVSQGVEWFSRASLWKKALITSLLGLLCAMVFNTLRGTPSKGAYNVGYTCSFGLYSRTQTPWLRRKYIRCPDFRE